MASAPENSDSEADPVDKLITRLDTISVSDRGGRWRSDHPWESEKPNPKLKMKPFVTNSKSYPIPYPWTRRNGDVDLAKIFRNLARFVEDQMPGGINGCRQELEWVIKVSLSNNYCFNPYKGEPSPHAREILNISSGNDKTFSPSDSHFLKARSIQHDDFECSRSNSYGGLFYIDCEYILKMYVPGDWISWFDIEELEEMQWIRKISYPNKEKRWIFIPSFRRAKIALLDWPDDDIVTEDSTIRILVVRPSEFEEYKYFCGHKFPIICLPQDEIGVGYSRYWIQKIAQNLKLQFIWMIDDSVECFYEYLNTENHKYTLLQFGLVFKRIEDFVKEADDNDKPIAAMSPRRVNQWYRVTAPFVCKPPQCAVYLNLRALSEKNVRYRPELHVKTLEDMIFGYECEQKGLKVYMDNRVHLEDHNWKNSGARSPSVKCN